MKCQRKPIETEAVKWFGNNFDEIKKFCPTAELSYNHIISNSNNGHIDSIDIGGYIVKDIYGEYVFCEEKEFKANYDVQTMDADKPVKKKKCPYCGKDLLDFENGSYYCQHCHWHNYSAAQEHCNEVECTAENNKLRAENSELRVELQAMRNAANGFKAEFERVNKLNEFLRKTIAENAQMAFRVALEEIELAKTDAYKEFAKKLSARCNDEKDVIEETLKELIDED